MFVDQQLRNSFYGDAAQIANSLTRIWGFYITRNYTHTQIRTRARGRIRLNKEQGYHKRRCQQNTQQTQETNILIISGIRTLNSNAYRPTPYAAKLPDKHYIILRRMKIWDWVWPRDWKQSKTPRPI